MNQHVLPAWTIVCKVAEKDLFDLTDIGSFEVCGIRVFMKVDGSDPRNQEIELNNENWRFRFILAGNTEMNYPFGFSSFSGDEEIFERDLMIMKMRLQ